MTYLTHPYPHTRTEYLFSDGRPAGHSETVSDADVLIERFFLDDGRRFTVTVVPKLKLRTVVFE